MATKRQFYFDSCQGVDEDIAYTLDASKWGSLSPAGLSVVAKDSTGGDVSVTLLTGSASASGSIITTPLIGSGTEGATYRIEVLWTDSGNTVVAYGFLTFEE